MAFEVFLSAQAFTETDVRGKDVVIIDVFRSSATIITALHQGAKYVIPVADMAEAGRLARGTTAAIFGGERKGGKIDGYDLGNSPLDYVSDVVGKKTVVLNSTNGTPAISKASKTAARVMVATFLNLQVVADELNATGNDVVIICSGSLGRPSIEDSICAGALVNLIHNNHIDSGIADDATIAFGLYRLAEKKLENVIMTGVKAKSLTEAGSSADIVFCLKLNAIPLIPIFDDGRLVIKK